MYVYLCACVCVFVCYRPKMLDYFFFFQCIYIRIQPHLNFIENNILYVYIYICVALKALPHSERAVCTAKSTVHISYPEAVTSYLYVKFIHEHQSRKSNGLYGGDIRVNYTLSNYILKLTLPQKKHRSRNY